MRRAPIDAFSSVSSSRRRPPRAENPTTSSPGRVGLGRRRAFPPTAPSRDRARRRNVIPRALSRVARVASRRAHLHREMVILQGVRHPLRHRHRLLPDARLLRLDRRANDGATARGGLRGNRGIASGERRDLRGEHRARASSSRSDARASPTGARVRDGVDFALGRVHTSVSFRLLYEARSPVGVIKTERDTALARARARAARGRAVADVTSPRGARPSRDMAAGETTKTLVMRQTQEAVGKSASRVGERRTDEGWENSTVRVPENE